MHGLLVDLCHMLEFGHAVPLVRCQQLFVPVDVLRGQLPRGDVQQLGHDVRRLHEPVRELRELGHNVHLVRNHLPVLQQLVQHVLPRRVVCPVYERYCLLALQLECLRDLLGLGHQLHLLPVRPAAFQLGLLHHLSRRHLPRHGVVRLRALLVTMRVVHGRGHKRLSLVQPHRQPAAALRLDVLLVLPQWLLCQLVVALQQLHVPVRQLRQQQCHLHVVCRQHVPERKLLPALVPRRNVHVGLHVRPVLLPMLGLLELGLAVHRLFGQQAAALPGPVLLGMSRWHVQQLGVDLLAVLVAVRQLLRIGDDLHDLHLQLLPLPEPVDVRFLVSLGLLYQQHRVLAVHVSLPVVRVHLADLVPKLRLWNVPVQPQ